MKQLYYKILKSYSRIEGKIAFYPTLISLWGVIFAFIMYYAENQGISRYLVDEFPLLVIDDLATARLILSTFIAGLISIMVFSFSMVMILLNNASSNFSPRVLPGIISNRRHQFILGVYNASLLYFIFTLVSIEPTGDKYQLPGFSVLLAIFSMILCLGMFIYFIHSISQEIQVDNIIERIYHEVFGRLKVLIKEENLEHHDFSAFKGSNEWESCFANSSGYLQDVNVEALAKICEEQNTKMLVVPVKGMYVFKDEVLFRLQKMGGNDLTESLYSHFVFNNDELVDENYVLGFKQITEIAVKAMSPGINDPGTCINAIDYLTGLFLMRMKKSDTSYILHNDQPMVETNILAFEEILYNVMASLRTYVTHDILICNKLMLMFEKLLKTEDFASQKYRIAIIMEVESLQDDVHKSIKNERDLKLFEKKINEIKAFVA